ncbi:DNA-binding protein [Solirubrobacter sp. CPCC 204708]|uniref:DNA-binding protein n=1 Tax=Solirubrobacter deserti TaxID=2282478 RepID=A0ABT4RPS1_9ACTN|nr:hypothetical protein [Solirubrobacter deserti]MBE2316662.1 DNA-binding protein [Solirubrobacter deserti]MDA0140561.1 hypothetical protein [Solirubrobacter deserti]
MAIAIPEADRLAAALAKRMGRTTFTARELADELVASDSPAELLTALEDALARAAEADETEPLDEALWGSAPGEHELADIRRTAQQAQQEALGLVLADALTRQQAAELLGISPQAVSKRHAAGSLVALARGREQHFPAWQFHEGATLPGLAEVIAAYPGGALSLSTWATTPNPDLEGRSPERTLTRRGGVEQVLAAIEAITAAAW